MRKLEIRGGKILDGGADTPKGFHLYCDSSVGLLLCDAFATAAYLSAGNSLSGRSVRIAKNAGGKPTARAVLLSNCSSDVLQKDGRETVTAQVNYASDKLGVPASEVRPLFVGELIRQSDRSVVLEHIDNCAKALLSGQSSDASKMGVETLSCAVQFYLGDDYPCIISGTLFTERACRAIKRTLLVTTDVSISWELLQAALESEYKDTFGLLPIPPSANDGCVALSSGLAGNHTIAFKDVEYAKFSKALQYVFSELCARLVCGDGEDERLYFQAVGTKSKRTACDVVKNAYSYFMLSGNERASLIKGMISCVGDAGILSRRGLRVWLESAAGRILLIDGGKFMYVLESTAASVLAGDDAILTVDFREGNYSARGWIKKEKRVVFF